MNVLVIGSGGREHALCWKIKKSKRCSKLYSAPGNGGIAKEAVCVPIETHQLKEILEFSKREKIDLVVVGPDVPLVEGIVDLFEKEHIPIFGPSQGAALLEGSKVFAKELMSQLKIPTAPFAIFSRAEEAMDYVAKHKFPLVIKADGLAAGKGVTVASSLPEAIEAIQLMMIKKIFGKSGEKIIIEDFLEGEEASLLVVSDGENILPLASSQDHKRAYDGDKGPNTGGMGAYSPAPVVTDALFDEVTQRAFLPVIRELKARGTPYKGVLYAGIIVTSEGPRVLEFNVRFGDPETQAILPRLKGDILEVFEAALNGSLSKVSVSWDSRHAVCVVVTSGGYPGSYEKGKKISGLSIPQEKEGVILFHAGTTQQGNELVTDGGRVLGVVGMDDSIFAAVGKTYQAVEKIYFENMAYRKDIGYRATNARVY